MREKKVLVVDDSAYYRRSIIKMLEDVEGVEVVGYARNGRDALKKVRSLKPDVILLDLEMPELDGFSFLRILMSHNPIPVIVVSSLSESENVYQALELGAVDFIPKPTKKISPAIYNIKDQLVSKIKAVSETSLRKGPRETAPLSVKVREGTPPPSPRVKTVGAPSVEEETDLIAVAIGASTGGPSALQRVLSGIRYNPHLVVFISQHIPPGFSRPFAERLNRYSELFVKEAEDDEQVKGGYTYVCPGGYSMAITGKQGKIYVKLERNVAERYIPSIDRMMECVGRIFGKRAMGVILTGMGNDGASGIKVIRDQGGYTVAESPETAVIYGMPGEAVKRGVVSKSLPLQAISGEINEWVFRWSFKIRKIAGDRHER